MATTVDTLVTRYVLQGQQYTAAANDVTAATAGMSASFAKVSGFVSTASTAIIGAGAAVVGYVAAVGALSRAGAEMEAQTMALSLYATAAKDTTAMLKDLQEVAKLPGLGNLEAIQGAVRLMAGGFSFDQATASMMAFGNAIASAGGGREELDGVMLALTQIASKGKVSAEEINQIAERVPQIRQAMIGAFGTANTEEIQKMGIEAKAFIAGIVAQLALLPPAASGFKNEFSNMQDAIGRGMAEIGMGINSGLLGPLKEASGFLSFLGDSGFFKSVGASFGALFGDMFGTGSGRSPVVTGLAYMAGALEAMPTLVNVAFETLMVALEEVWRRFAMIFNAIRTVNPAARIMMPEYDPDMLGGIKGLSERSAPFNLVQANAENLLARYDIAQRKSQAERLGFEFTEDSSAGTNPVELELEKQTETLRAIERNTSPTNARILGGGNLGAIGVTPVELSGMGGRGGKMNQLVDLLQGLVREEAAVIAAGMITRAGRLSGF